MSPSDSATRSFALQGHRGARGLFPENTLEGFLATAAMGVDAIELDVALTADGEVVVTHDSELNPDLTRGPDGAWLTAAGPPIRRLTLAELARYDVGRLRPGSRLASLHSQQVPHDGARIPRLADVFARVTGPVIDVELKTQPDRPGLTASPAELADAVLAVAAPARLALRSFDWRGLRHLRARGVADNLTWLTSPQTVRHAALWWDGPTPAAFGHSVPATVAAEAAGTRAPCWAPEHVDLTRNQIAEAQALGLRVIPWTVNLPADMARLMAWGVDGFCTDRPDLARAAMHSAGLALPAPRP